MYNMMVDGQDQCAVNGAHDDLLADIKYELPQRPQASTSPLAVRQEAPDVTHAMGCKPVVDRQRQCQMNNGGVKVISKTRPINACIHAPFWFGSRRQPQVSEPRAPRRWCHHGSAKNAELRYDLSEG
jgi:hypothetical protein